MRPSLHAATVLALLGLAASNADGGRAVEPVPVSWRPGEKRGPAPDLREEIRGYMGKTWRHRITGQVRHVYMDQTEDGVEWSQGTEDHPRFLRATSLRKALRWLRNAEEVQS